MPPRRPVVLAALTASALGAGLLPAPAATPVSFPGVKQYAATIDVAGRIVVTESFATTGPCAPGRKYDLVTTVDLELGLPRKVAVSVAPRLVGTSEARTRGRGEARTRVEVERLSTTNHCAPTPEVPVPDPGPCGDVDGDMAASLFGAPVPGRKGLPLRLVVTRLNGPSLPANDGCRIASASSGPDVRPALALSVLPARRTGLTVPLAYDGARLARLKPGRAMARRVTFSGICEAVGAKSAVPRVIGPDGSVVRDRCRVAGHVWVRIKRVPR